MNTETLQDISQQAETLARNIEALSDPDTVRTLVSDAVTAAQQPEDAQTSAALEQGVAKELVRRARNKADKVVKSGHYAYPPKEYGNVRITASGAVYTASKTGW